MRVQAVTRALKDTLHACSTAQYCNTHREASKHHQCHRHILLKDAPVCTETRSLQECRVCSVVLGRWTETHEPHPNPSNTQMICCAAWQCTMVNMKCTTLWNKVVPHAPSRFEFNMTRTCVSICEKSAWQLLGERPTCQTTATVA